MDINIVWDEVEKIFVDDTSGHDYWHTFRVYHNALKIADNEKCSCDLQLIKVLALLHDVDDQKLFANKNYENARNILKKAGTDKEEIDVVISNIKQISYKGAESITPSSIEGKIVQDADRIDALGAIGIARAFSYGGNKGRCMHNPNIRPEYLIDAQAYLNSEGTTVNHFYEKLFLLKDRMNTTTARLIADKREKYMREFLDEFYREWDE